VVALPAPSLKRRNGEERDIDRPVALAGACSFFRLAVAAAIHLCRCWWCAT
jgi:hypothetical protein